MFSPPQIFNLVSADFFSHTLTARLKARHHINLFKYLDIIQVVFFYPFPPLSGGERGGGYVSAINILTDFRERQLGNKRPYTSSWLIGSFIHITEWYFYGSAFFRSPWMMKRCTRVCVCTCVRCHFAFSPCDSLKADSSVCHFHEGLMTAVLRERKWETERALETWGERENVLMASDKKVRMWGDCENGCGIINGHHECNGWLMEHPNSVILTIRSNGCFSKTATVHNMSEGSFCIISQKMHLCRAMLMEEVKVRAAQALTANMQRVSPVYSNKWV